MNPWNNTNNIRRLLLNFLKNGDFNKKIAYIILAFVVIIWISTGIYIVKPNEISVVTRFGKWVRNDDSGLRYKIPYPIDIATIVSVTTISKIDVGTNAEENLMLTGDSNLANVGFSVFWKIKNVNNYVFNTRNPEEIIEMSSESIIREIIGQTPIAYTQTTGREELNRTAKKKLQELLDKYEIGVEVVEVMLQTVDPPAAAIMSFREVEQAQAEQQKEINIAEGYSRDIAARTKGKVADIINKAASERAKKIEFAKGIMLKMKAIEADYNSNKEIVMHIMYHDVVSKILAKSKRIIISSNDNFLKHINIDKNGEVK